MERLTARNDKGLAYLKDVKPNEQSIESSYPNTLKCILNCFQRLAELEDMIEDGRLKEVCDKPKPLTLDELKERSKKLFGWVWVEVLKPYTEYQKSAYYQIYSDYTDGKGLCCGYPGLGFTYDFDEYGKTWIAYDHEPKGVE